MTDARSKSSYTVGVGQVGLSPSAWNFDVRALLAVLVTSCAIVALAYWPLYHGNAVAPSDGQFGTFLRPFAFWSDDYIGGWPAYADPTSMSSYPLRYLFPRTSNGFTAFVLSAFVVFGAGNGMLALEVTNSRRAAVAVAAWSPLVGFMVGHLGHTSIVHAWAWAPWIMMGAFRIGEPRGYRAPAIGVFALAAGMSLLAGHPQLSLYAVAGASLLAIPTRWRELKQWLQSVGAYVAAVVIGAAIALPLLLPATAFAKETMRSAMTPQALSEFSATLQSLLLVFVPYAAGGEWTAGSQTPFSAPGSWDETVSYVGLSVLVLIVAVLCRSRPTAAVAKLFALTAAGFILAVLPSIHGVAAWLQWIPIFSDFRAWARWLALVSVGALQLAALGLFSEKQRADFASRHVTALAVAALIMTVWLALIILAATESSVGEPSSRLLGGLILWQLLTGVAVAVCLGVAFNAIARRREWYLFVAAALVCVELVLLARGAAWANAYPREATTKEQAALNAIARESNGRVLALSGWESTALAPDMTRREGIPSMNWYGPLLSNRVAELVGLTSGGWTRPQSLIADDQTLDIYAVDVVESYVSGEALSNGRWPILERGGLRLGPGCSESNPKAMELRFDRPHDVSGVELVSSLACSVALTDGTIVARQSLFVADGHSRGQDVIVGSDTAEWAAACLDQGAGLAHRAPTPLRRIRADSGASSCAGSVYAARRLGPLSDTTVYRVEFSGNAAALVVHGLRLDIDGRAINVPANVLQALNGSRWRVIGLTDRGLLLRNTRALTRFRFVARGIELDDSQSLAALKTSRLRDGSRFDASTTATLPVGSGVAGIYTTGSGIVPHLTHGRIKLDIPASASRGLLIIGDNFSPHWQATVAGKTTPVLRVNYNQMGIVIPAGANSVELVFVDHAWRYSIVLAAMAALVSLLLLLIPMGAGRLLRRNGAG